MTPITHEQCSEALAAYIGGELPAPEAEAIRSHLDGCGSCRGEEAGLRALMAGDTEPGGWAGELSESERARLRSGVMASIATSGESSSLYKLQRPARDPHREPTNWRARMAGAMAAAAGIVLVAGLFYLGAGGVGGQDEGGAQTGLSDGGGDTAERNEIQQATSEVQDADAAADAGVGELESAAGTGSGTTTSSEGFVAPMPAFLGGERRYNDARVQKLGERGLQLILFRRAYTADDVSRLQEDFVDRLANSAARRAGEAAAEQVRDCARVVLAREETALPAFGAFGRRENRDVLVLGFAWSDDSSRLERYMVWTWARGSCDSPLDFRSGTIKPAN